MPSISGGKGGIAKVLLPLVQADPQPNGKVPLKIIGSILAEPGAADGKYIAAGGLYTSDPSLAADFRGSPGQTVTEDGLQGDPGVPGATGKSAYELWLMAGNSGDQATFFASMKGPKGDPGNIGLKGDPGDTGPAGAQGATGSTGPTGITGPKGDTGLAGATGPGGATLVGTATIGQTAGIAISAGVRSLSVTVSGVVVGGNYLLFPDVSMAPLATSYLIHSVIATAANTLQVTLTAPLLAIGASYSFTARVVRINT